MAADTLVPSVTRSSAAMVSTLQEKQVLGFNVEDFQQPAPSWCLEMIDNVNTFICLLHYYCKQFSMGRDKSALHYI